MTKVYELNNINGENRNNTTDNLNKKEILQKSKIGKDLANNKELFEVLQFQNIFSDTETDVGTVKDFEYTVILN